MEKPIIQKKTTRAALYMRLSRDDERAGESESIQNQRDLLRRFADESQMTIVGEYIDDGWSGTNFDRPDFKRMIQDIESGRINCVITKDLSRLGRNYIEVGRYTDYYFPSKKVRYIAVNDRVDTALDDNDAAPFLNVFNEFHAKQTSKKTRSVFESKFKSGAHCNNVLPYGYEKDPQQKGRIRINEAQAKVVRLIFDLAQSGVGSVKIAKYLYEHRIESPGYALYVSRGYFRDIYEGASDDKKYEWNVCRIKKMLRNEIYIGNAVHYRERTPSFKDKRTVYLPADQWMVVKGTHEAIISPEQFEAVQRKIEARYRKTGDGFVQVFSGIARCADCGKLLRFNVNRQHKGREYMYLMCSGKKSVPNETCTTHYIRYDTLKQCVLENIQALLRAYELDKDALLRRLIRTSGEQDKQNEACNAGTLQKLSARKGELDAMFKRLYEDWGSGRISEQNFTMMIENVQREQDSIAQRMSDLSRTDAASDEAERAKRFAQIIESIAYPQELTRELVHALIDRIEVHESEGPKGARNKKQVVEIYYRFAGMPV
ncbi:MAG: recombinase family protein [Clostridia bacterium]|nr:recombinase family protein [Clostridia bacterium]